MAEFAPHLDLFKIKTQLNLIGEYIFWIILFLSISALVLEEIDSLAAIKDLINILTIVGIVAFFILEILTEYIFLPLANEKRRDDFIDNSLGSKFAPKSSIGYYDNDEVGGGLFKVAVNQFENCFFTLSLCKIVTISKTLVPTVIFVLMAVISYYGFKEVPFALSLLQALFSAKILGSLIKHLILLNRLSSIQDSWIELFQHNNLKENIESYTANIYRYWLQYETLHSKIDAGIPDRVFNNYNDSLTEEWEKLKIKYKKK